MAVHVTFSRDGADRLRQPVDEAMVVPPEGFPADWSELVREIAALYPEVTITKRQWGAFHGTELDLQLRRRGVRSIVIGGIRTAIGVESTARTGYALGYEVVFASDAITDVDASLHDRAFAGIFPRLGRSASTSDILAALPPEPSGDGRA